MINSVKLDTSVLGVFGTCDPFPKMLKLTAMYSQLLKGGQQFAVVTVGSWEMSGCLETMAVADAKKQTFLLS